MSGDSLEDIEAPLRALFHYQYEIFISYSKSDEGIAKGLLVQVLRGVPPESVMDGIHDWPWEDINLKDAHTDVLDFVAQGVSPFA
jgi:hypothetical protein